MRLNTLIEKLEAADGSKPCFVQYAANENEPVRELGFDHADSWRGSYEQLGIQPTDSSTVTSTARARKMLAGMIGDRVQGYKGGDYTISEFSPVWVDEYGDCTQQQVIRVTEHEDRVVLESAFVN